jgi:hypothetical protein
VIGSLYAASMRRVDHWHLGIGMGFDVLVQLVVDARERVRTIRVVWGGRSIEVSGIQPLVPGLGSFA